MSDDRWPKAILNMMDLCGTQTKMMKRAGVLKKKFGCDGIRVEPSRDNRTWLTIII